MDLIWEFHDYVLRSRGRLSTETYREDTILLSESILPMNKLNSSHFTFDVRSFMLPYTTTNRDIKYIHTLISIARAKPIWETKSDCSDMLEEIC